VKATDSTKRRQRPPSSGRAGSRIGELDADPDGRPRRERELVEIAVKHFNSKGYAGTAVQEIADEFGILKGSLYHYIKSKEDLLFLVLAETHEHLEQILDEVEQLTGLSAEELLREYIRRQISYTSRNLERMAIYYKESHHLSRERRRALEEKRDRHRVFIIGLISQLQEAGQVPADVPPGVLANVAIGSVNWLYTWYKPNGQVPPNAIAELCADFVIAGLTNLGADSQ
jgi:TetR/AcrR family transcriptional regulator, cholesterol catabolism regulator